jgi:hypothetical protein
MSHTQHPIELLRFNTCGSVDDGKARLRADEEVTTFAEF